MEKVKQSYFYSISLALIILLALAVRIYGIRFGLPYVYHPDEPALVGPVLNIVKTGDFNPRWFHWPSFYIYIQVVVFIGRFLIGAARGSYSSLSEVTLPGFYFVGRLTTAFFGTLTVYLTYLIARRMFNQKTALLAALFLTFSFLHVRDSHYLTVDVPATLFVALSFLFSYLVFETGEKKYYILAGFVGGLASATKYNAALIILPLLLAHLLFSWKKREFNEGLWFGLAFMGIGFFVGSPYAFLDLPTFLEGVVFDISHYATGHAGFEGVNNWVFYARYLFFEGMGPLFLFALGGILLGLYKHRGKDSILLIFPTVYFVFVSLQKVNFVRSLLLLFPFFAILGGMFLADITDGFSPRLGLSKKQANFMMVTLTILALVLPVIKILQFGYGSSIKSTRTLTAEWIEANIPKGSKIASEDYGPPVSGNYQLVNFNYLFEQSYQFYQQEAFDYLIFSSGSYGRFFKEPSIYREQVRRYAQLFKKAILVKKFPGDKRVEGFLSPTIRIYKVESESYR